MWEQVETGPLYDKTVRLMGTYRSIAARIGGAKASTQGKLDRRLQRLSERIEESISELTDKERMALDFWRPGITREHYELDHDALMEQPYRSIRLIHRWDEVHDRKSEPYVDTSSDEEMAQQMENVRAFLRKLDSM